MGKKLWNINSLLNVGGGQESPMEMIDAPKKRSETINSRGPTSE